MKTRSSSGVGQKVDLEFNVDTLRISDLGEEDNENYSSSQSGNKPSSGTASVMDSLKRTSVVTTSTEETPSRQQWEKPRAKEGFDLNKPQTKPALIRNLLNNLNPERD
jgi:hypothetical protein